MTDILLTLIIVFIMVPFLYVMDSQAFNVYTLPIAVIILIPTVYALIGGAPFVPTPFKGVRKMLKLAKIKKGDKVYDIGCGDGRMVYLAAKEYGANATGIEISPFVYVLARIRHFFWQSKAKILFRDINLFSLRDADVVVCYLLPEMLIKLQGKLEKELKKGSRIISYSFPIGNWEISRKIEKDPPNNLGPIWIYER